MADHPHVQVDFEPIGRRARVPAGSTLLDAAQAAGVELESICGGAGSCGGCRVRLAAGELTAPTRTEKDVLGPIDLDAGYRLACQAVPLGNVKLDIPPESLTAVQRLQVEGGEVGAAPDPVVTPLDIQLDPPTLEDLRADGTRLEAAVRARGRGSPHIGLSILRGLPGQLRAQNWSARLALRHGSEVVGLLPAGSPLLGLAVDVGTTKLAAYLVNLESGATVAKMGAMNPQIAYGEDVVSRIHYVNEHPEGGQVLQGKLVAALNELVAGLCAETGVSPQQVVEAVVVGNTVMHHLFAGLPVRQLGVAPYVPAVGRALELRAADVGLVLAPSARVYLPPNIAGYVGADHVATVLSSGVHEAACAAAKATIVLDIGTNTEITLAHAGRLLCCSCASGPAFEGAHIQDGMRAAPGAIERVQISGDAVYLHTVGNLPPVGICGSGMLDAVAELRRVEILDERGAFQEGRPHVRTREGKAEFVLAPAAATGHQHDVVVTRRDVNEIQLAKAAIRTGIEVLLAQGGVAAADIAEFIVAGAFGTYLDVRSAAQVGMFPAVPLQRFRQVGNAAGTGARQMLVSMGQRRTAAAIAERIEYVELTTCPSFTPLFLRAMYL